MAFLFVGSFGLWELPLHFLGQLGIVFTYLVLPAHTAPRRGQYETSRMINWPCFSVSMETEGLFCINFLYIVLISVNELLLYANNHGLFSWLYFSFDSVKQGKCVGKTWLSRKEIASWWRRRWAVKVGLGANHAWLR